MFVRIKLEIDSLVDDVLNQIPNKYWESESTTFFDPEMGGGQCIRGIIRKLRSFGHSDNNISKRVYGLSATVIDHNYIINKFNLIGNYSVANILDENVIISKNRFDVIVCSPPFTDGQKKIYAKIFEKTLYRCNIAAFIMPVTLSSTQVTVKNHNHRIKKHLIHMSDNLVNRFDNISHKDIRYVVVSRHTNNPVSEEKDTLDSLPLLYPNRKRLNPIKGDGNVAMAPTISSGIKTVQKIHREDKIVYRTISKKIADRSNMRSTAKYLVFVNHTPSAGRFNCAILKNNKNLTWSQWVFAFEANSLAEAKRLKSWLISGKIIDEINRMRSVKNNTHTVSKKMLARLPYYK